MDGTTMEILSRHTCKLEKMWSNSIMMRILILPYNVDLLSMYTCIIITVSWTILKTGNTVKIESHSI